MAGGNPSAYGGKFGNPKPVLCDREGEIVDLKTFGTRFERRQIFPIETLNPVNGITYLGPVGTALTAFQAGLVGLDWLLTPATLSPITGPTGINLDYWLSGKGNELPVGEYAKILYNLFASAGASNFYNPLTNMFSAQDWIINFDNSDTVNSKVINFGAGVTPASLTIPAGATVQVRFELTGIGLVRIVPIISSGVAMGFLLPGGAGNAGPPLEGHDLLVFDNTTNTWVPSGLSTALRGGRLPTLLIGASSTVYGPLDNFALVVRGNPPQGLITGFLTGNITSAQEYDLIRSDATQSVNNFGNRGFIDCTYNSRMLSTAANPVDANLQGVGAYHFIGGRDIAGVFTHNFDITGNGQISRFTPMVTAALAALSVSAAGGLTQGVSRQEYKENIVNLGRVESDLYFDSLHPVDFNYIGLETLPRIGFVVQQSEADLGANDNRLFSFLPGSPIDLTYRADFDNRAVISLLVEQVKNLKARVTALENP